MSEFKVAVNNESDFNVVMALAESMGYYNGLEFKYIPNVKVLFLPSDSKHISWSHRGIDKYKGRFGKEISIEELKEIAALHRIDKPSNSRELETIDEPVGSLQELHPEFAKVLHENFLELLGDDDHIENHISPNCQSRDA
ncbi:hypothetical protein Q5X44_17925 [Acinetobacter baumannii]|nr:hypothetical protein [Acinetobacter baumannii]